MGSQLPIGHIGRQGEFMDAQTAARALWGCFLTPGRRHLLRRDLYAIRSLRHSGRTHFHLKQDGHLLHRADRGSHMDLASQLANFPDAG